MLNVSLTARDAKQHADAIKRLSPLSLGTVYAWVDRVDKEEDQYLVNQLVRFECKDCHHIGANVIVPAASVMVCTPEEKEIHRNA